MLLRGGLTTEVISWGLKTKQIAALPAVTPMTNTRYDTAPKGEENKQEFLSPLGRGSGWGQNGATFTITLR